MSPVKYMLAGLLLLCLVHTAVSCLPFGAISDKVSGIFKSKPKRSFMVTIGCYTLRKPEEYKGDFGSVSAVEAITWDKCRDHCYGTKGEAPNEDRIGMQDINCWCKYNYPKGDQTTDSKCDVLCAGNEKETCGGKEYISVYAARLVKS